MAALLLKLWLLECTLHEWGREDFCFRVLDVVVCVSYFRSSTYPEHFRVVSLETFNSWTDRAPLFQSDHCGHASSVSAETLGCTVGDCDDAITLDLPVRGIWQPDIYFAAWMQSRSSDLLYWDHEPAVGMRFHQKSSGLCWLPSRTGWCKAHAGSQLHPWCSRVCVCVYICIYIYICIHVSRL